MTGGRKKNQTTEKSLDTTEKRIEVGNRIEIVGDYRGFLQDLKGFVGTVRGIYECRGETRYITYLPTLDEYVEPTIKNVKLIVAGVEELNDAVKRSIHQSGSLCA